MKPISLPPTPGALAFAGAEPPAAAVVAAPPAVVAGVSLASLFEPHAASATAPATSKGMTRLMFKLVPSVGVVRGSDHRLLEDLLQAFGDLVAALPAQQDQDEEGDDVGDGIEGELVDPVAAGLQGR